MANLRPLLGLLVVIAIGAAGCGASGASLGPTAPRGAGPAVARASSADAAPVPIAGGCGATQLFAWPGPSRNPGLESNPWARAEPASAGIVAYFWGQPPYLSAGSQRPHGESNKVLWVTDAGGNSLTIVAHLLDRSAPAVRFAFPASGAHFPSSIDLPTPGCWRLDLALSNGVTATIGLLVAPAPNAVATPAPTPPTDPLAGLRRDIRVPALDAAGRCPVTTIGRTVVYGSITYASGATASGVNQLQGNGPAYTGWLYGASTADWQPDASGYGNKFLFAIDDREYGPLLLRGTRVDGPGRVTFNNGSDELVVGQDATSGAIQRPPAGALRPPISRIYVLGITVPVAGCYVIQADGATSSTSIVFELATTTSPGRDLLAGDPARALLARPFTVPADAGTCAIGPVSVRSGFGGRAAGSGTVFLAGAGARLTLSGAETRPDGSKGVKTIWVNTDPAARPVVIRGSRIEGPQSIRFEGGLTSGSQPFLYLAGDSGVSSEGVPLQWQQWPTTTIFPGVGCHVFQVDGVDFTERFVVQIARWRTTSRLA